MKMNDADLAIEAKALVVLAFRNGPIAELQGENFCGSSVTVLVSSIHLKAA